MEWYIKLLIGGLGGLAATLSKILALDAATLAAVLWARNKPAADNIRVMILVHSPIMIALGMIVASMVDETVPIKLFAIGVSAPALIAPWLASGPVKILSREAMAAKAQPNVANAGAEDPISPVGRVNALKFLIGMRR